MERLRKLLLTGLVLVLVAALYWLWFDVAKEQHKTLQLPRSLQSSVLPRPKPLPPFQLTDLDDQPLGPERFQGKWTFLFFGYTHCPDICPTTLFTLQQVRRRLLQTPAYLADTQFLFVTLDPRRDTPELLRGYVRHFDPSFLAARGDSATLDRLTTALGAPYAIEPSDGADEYVVNHSATILLIDPQARYYARFASTSGAEAISDAFSRARDFYNR